MKGSGEAAEYLAWLQNQLKDHDLILVHRPLGKHPRYFCGLHHRTRVPVYSYSAHLARRFPTNDGVLKAFVDHLQRSHGHDVYVSKHPKVSGAPAHGK